jgi:cytochrome c biogenesis protein CcdA
MVLFALLGGLILNLMPCVLPVMGMKLNSILQAGSDRRAIRLRFLATSAGILTSFMLLAGMVTALKLAGASLGWGIQFQNPWFIGLMVAVTFLFALNLFGAFEMLLPSAATGRLATAGIGDWRQLLRRDVRHAAGDAVLRAVPRYGGRLCPWRAAALPVADLPDARRGHEPAVAVCRPGAENGHAAAETRPLDELR